MRSSAVVGLAIVVLLVVTVGYHLHAQPITQRKVLVVGVDASLSPFEFVKNKQVTGFEIQLIRTLAQRVGYDDIIVKDMPFGSLITALQNGEIDVIAARMTITPDRQNQVDLTNPYWEADQSILDFYLPYLENLFNDPGPQSIADLAGRTVGVQTGTVGAELAETNNASLGPIKHYDTFLLAVLDMLKGRVDAVLVDHSAAVAFTTGYPVQVSSTVSTGVRWGFAVKKGNSTLLDALNKALRDFKDSMEWKDLVRKYFGKQ